tara:strand:+ start:41390 stop:41962 length:573 start_codon:yes stop_codon:yes gene_type:complete
MASRGVNKVILLGNLGQDPDIKQGQNALVGNFSVATSETWKDKQTGEQRENTEWHRCVVYRKLAEIVQQLNVSKGSKVYVEGKLKTRQWQDQNGIDRYTTEIVVDEFQLLDSKQGQGQQPQQSQQPAPAPQQAPQQQPQQPAPAPQQAPQQQPQQPAPAPQQAPQQQPQQPAPAPQQAPSNDDFDDDIPF